MSGLFSSPGKSASSGTSNLISQLQPLINQEEQYVGQQQQNERGAIAGVPNPYFTAAQAMNPEAYAVNPNQTATFGTTAGPGTHLGNTSIAMAGPPAPPWQPPEPKGGGGRDSGTAPTSGGTGWSGLGGGGGLNGTPPPGGTPLHQRY